MNSFYLNTAQGMTEWRYLSNTVVLEEDAKMLSWQIKSSSCLYVFVVMYFSRDVTCTLWLWCWHVLLEANRHAAPIEMTVNSRSLVSIQFHLRYDFRILIYYSTLNWHALWLIFSILRFPLDAEINIRHHGRVKKNANSCHKDWLEEGMDPRCTIIPYTSLD